MAVIESERPNARRERLLGDAPGAFAQARFVRISASKARRVINLIRGLTTSEAMAALRFAPQAASQPIAKVLASAVANAENNERLDPELLLVSSAFVDEGPTLKRIQPRAQGRAYRILKRSCHITVVVESVEATKPGRGARASGKGSGQGRAQRPVDTSKATTAKGSVKSLTTNHTTKKAPKKASDTSAKATDSTSSAAATHNISAAATQNISAAADEGGQK